MLLQRNKRNKYIRINKKSHTLLKINFLFFRIGRKKPLMIALGLQSLTGFICAFVPWFELFVIFKFISAVATGGTMLVSFVLRK